MRFRIVRVASFVFVATIVASIVQAEEKPQPFTAETAYETLRSLSGDWVNVEHPEDLKQGVVFRGTAAGSAVSATLYPGGPMEMMSLFHLDGKDKLVHTHYCALQNQPTMLFVRTDEPNRMRFEFAHGMSLDVNKDLHTHHTEFRLLEDGQVEVHIDTWQNGKTNNIVTFTVQRKTDK